MPTNSKPSCSACVRAPACRLRMELGACVSRHALVVVTFSGGTWIQNDQRAAARLEEALAPECSLYLVNA